MKVIDLLNKIANGEKVPEKIQVYSDIFVFDNSNGIYEHEETRTNLLSIYNGNILNYEVKIIEDKKIEKNIDKIDIDYFTKIKKTEKNKYLAMKINSIIEYLEENK